MSREAPPTAFGLGWMDRGMQLAGAIAKKDPAFAEKLHEATSKMHETAAKLRGSQRRAGTMLALEQTIEKLQRQGAVLVGTDFTAKESRL